MTTQRSPILEIKDLTVSLRGRGVGYDIVRNVCLSLHEREVLAVVGESGCGKSVTALSVLALHASPPLHITAGSIQYDGSDLTQAAKAEMQRIRGAEIAMVFQDPMSALDPMFTVGTLLTSAVRAHRSMTKAAAKEIGLDALAAAGIEDPRRRFDEYPFQLSGGVSQRAMIALALVNDPKVIIADEPTTALDVTVQAQILDRLRELTSERGMSVMLITHNLGVVAAVADRMAVMYAGEVVEAGGVAETLANPTHPYTMGLLGAVPRLGSGVAMLTPIAGRVPQPSEYPIGCSFAARCDRVTDECTAQRPQLEPRGASDVRCFHPIGATG